MRAVSEKDLSAGVFGPGTTDGVAATRHQTQNRLVDARAIRQHLFPRRTAHVVEVKIHGEAGWRPEAELEGRAALEGEALAEEPVPGDIASQLAEPDDLFQRTFGVARVCSAPGQIFAANAHRVRLP